MSEPRHGTMQRYSKLKCRCAECRTAWSLYMKRNRAERFAWRQLSRHGDPNTYNMGCRCDECRKARSAYDAEQYAKRKAQA